MALITPQLYNIYERFYSTKKFVYGYCDQDEHCGQDVHYYCVYRKESLMFHNMSGPSVMSDMESEYFYDFLGNTVTQLTCTCDFYELYKPKTITKWVCAFNE